MDQERQIRFAIPPFFLIGSLAFGLFQSPNNFRTWITTAETEHLLAAGAAIAASTLPIGFVISAVTFLILPMCFYFSKRNFAAGLSRNALETIWPQLRSSKEFDYKYVFEATTTFDHELLSPGIHSWIVRLWNMFLISAQSIVALVLVHIVALVFSIEQPREWFILTTVLAVILLLNACATWARTMGMLEFQAYREHGEIDKKAGADAVNTHMPLTNRLQGAELVDDPNLSK